MLGADGGDGGDGASGGAGLDGFVSSFNVGGDGVGASDFLDSNSGTNTSNSDGTTTSIGEVVVDGVTSVASGSNVDGELFINVPHALQNLALIPLTTPHFKQARSAVGFGDSRTSLWLKRNPHFLQKAALSEQAVRHFGQFIGIDFL